MDRCWRPAWFFAAKADNSWEWPQGQSQGQSQVEQWEWQWEWNGIIGISWYHGYRQSEEITQRYPECHASSIPHPGLRPHACSRRSRNWRCNTSPLMPWLSRKRPSYALKGQRTKNLTTSKEKEWPRFKRENKHNITKPCREYQAGTCGNCKIWLQLRMSFLCAHPFDCLPRTAWQLMDLVPLCICQKMETSVRQRGTCGGAFTTAINSICGKYMQNHAKSCKYQVL